MTEDRPDYGIDAPGVVRNLLLVAAIALAIWISRLRGVWDGVVRIPVGGPRLVFPFGQMAPWLFAGFAGTAAWMLWDSRIGKLRDRESFLDRIAWRGDERVLDVGCGRGLMLIAAAKRLTSGTATGVDIWQAEDLSGNKPEATLKNADIEGVRSRVDVRTADMRKLPFPDATFDVVVSCAAIHNLYASADRAKAIAEIARVLKPGGRALIDDIRHGGEYTAALQSRGCRQVQRVDSRAGSLLASAMTIGSLRPVKLIARKGTAS